MRRTNPVWVDLFAAPANSTLFNRTNLLDLISEMLTQQYVWLPWAVLVGNLEPGSPMGMAAIARGENRGQYADIAKTHTGQTAAPLLEQLHTLPGDQSWAIWFKGLNWYHPQIGKPFETTQGARNGDVLFFSMTAPTPVLITNAYQNDWRSTTLQHFLVLSAANGPRTFHATILDTVLQKHLGPDYRTETGFS